MKKIFSTILITIISILIFLPNVYAADIGDAFNATSTSVLSQTADSAGFYQGEENNINNVTQTIINAVLSFLGIIFTVIIIYAGIKWMTAEGNPDSVTKAKSLLKNAVIGLIIVLAAYAISIAIFSFFIESSPTLEYNQ